MCPLRILYEACDVAVGRVSTVTSGMGADLRQTCQSRGGATQGYSECQAHVNSHIWRSGTFHGSCLFESQYYPRLEGYYYEGRACPGVQRVHLDVLRVLS